MNRDLIEGLPHLEIISVYGVGYDAVDLDAARERNIRVPAQSHHQTQPARRSTGSIVWYPDQQIMLSGVVLGGVWTFYVGG
jgi:hypothetical protein